jgi:hypothetical protein
VRALELFSPVLTFGNDRSDGAPVVKDLRDPAPLQHRVPHGFQTTSHALPHLAGATLGIRKPRYQTTDGVSIRPSKRGAHKTHKGKIADPLGCPVSADFRARNSPYFLRVSPKEHLEQTLAEMVCDILLEVFDFAVRKEVPSQVTGNNA